MARKLALLFIMVSVLLTSPGCWNRREVDQLAIVVAAGFDILQDNTVLLTAQIAKPGNIANKFGGGGAGSGGGESVVIASAKGRTAFEAIQRINQKIPRSYYFGNNRIVVISEALTKGNRLRDILEILTSQRLIRRTRLLFISKGPARDVIELLAYVEKLPSEDIFKQFNSQSEVSTFTETNLNTLMNRMNAKDTEPIANGIAIVDAVDPKAKNIKGDKGQLPDKQRSSNVEKKIAKVSGVAVFRKLQMIGWLDGEETKDMLLIRGEHARTEIVVPYKGDRGVTYSLIDNKTKITPKIIGGRLNFEVNIKAKAILEEIDFPFELKEPVTVEAMTKDLNKVIKVHVEKTLKKVQKEYRSDIFGFGQKFHRKYRQEWEQVRDKWDDTFANAEINIKVETEITGSQLMENTF